jgi:hypothetical protein
VIEPVKDCFKDLRAARESHIEYGGILLKERGGFVVCHCLAHLQGCQCRSDKYLESLSPSWDETDQADPDPTQPQLF